MRSTGTSRGAEPSLFRISTLPLRSPLPGAFPVGKVELLARFVDFRDSDKLRKSFMLRARWLATLSRDRSASARQIAL